MADYARRVRDREARIRRTFVTPEGVDLSLSLAEPGQRFTAFVIDFLIIAGTLIALTLSVVLGVFSVGMGSLQVAGVIWLLGFFLLRNCYFILMEMGPRAATFGKRIIGLRVVSRGGGRLTADAVIARNLMRELEFYLPLMFLAYNSGQGTADGAMAAFGLGWACLFLFFPFFNRDRLRVGDLLAGTWVVHAPKRKLGVELFRPREPAGRGYSFADEQLDVYGEFELQALENVLRARDSNAMGTVAFTIREKIGADQHGGDEEFLRAYYDALRLRLERRMLFGRRRRDKHDRGS